MTETYPTAWAYEQVCKAFHLRTAERDFWIMKYMRLEAAINHHERSDNFKDTHDDALYRMRDKLAATHFDDSEAPLTRPDQETTAHRE